MKQVHSRAAPSPVGPYSQAIVHAGLVFASGQVPIDPATGALVEGDIEAQTERVLANLSAVLEAAGSSLDLVLRTTVYLTDLGLFPRVNAIYARHFDRTPQPARVTVQAAALPLGAQIEIDAIATTASAPNPGASSARRSA